MNTIEDIGCKDIDNLGLPQRLVEQLHRISVYNVAAILKGPVREYDNQFSWSVLHAIEVSDLVLIRTRLAEFGIIVD